MADCPKCSKSLGDEYGMVECSGCGSLLFVDMEGIAHLSGQALPSEGQTASAPAEDLGSVSAAEEWAPVADFSAGADEAASLAPEIAQGPAEELDRLDGPVDISAFADSDLSQAKDGPFLYRLEISGIDTKEIRESIREVIADGRFAWDADQILAQVKMGVLTLRDLAPVKASVLVTRLKRLSVKIRWEQYAITQSS